MSAVRPSERRKNPRSEVCRVVPEPTGVDRLSGSRSRSAASESPSVGNALAARGEEGCQPSLLCSSLALKAGSRQAQQVSSFSSRLSCANQRVPSLVGFACCWDLPARFMPLYQSAKEATSLVSWHGEGTGATMSKHAEQKPICGAPSFTPSGGPIGDAHAPYPGGLLSL